MSLPEDIVNRALDAIGVGQVIGSLQQGTRVAQVALRHYVPTIEQILRGAHWNVCRKTAPMLLLADMTGQTPNVGTQVPVPWTYEYAYPDDCLKARFVPWNNTNTAVAGPGGFPVGNTSVPPGPITGTTASPPVYPLMHPARFVEATDFNYPLPVPPEGPEPEWWNTRGTAPDMRTVILTNVPCAELIYTAWVPYPSLWDPLMQEAIVATLASRLAFPLADPKERMALRNTQIAIAKAALTQARITDGNEGWYTTDHMPDWITRRSGGWGFGRGWDWDGIGTLGYGWSPVAFCDGSAY